MRTLAVLFGMTWMVFFFTNPVLAESSSVVTQDTIEKFSTGNVNWTKGRIMASGIGVPNMDLPLVASKETAKRAAIIVAQRNLLELINGIRVDSETLVQNFLVKSDKIQTQVSGLIKGAKIESLEEYSHGGVEVTLSMPLWGNTSLESALSENSQPKRTPSPQSGFGEEYTGIIIDARKLGLKPAIYPKIIEENGQIIYGPQTPAKQALESQGFVQYETIPTSHMERMAWPGEEPFWVFPIENAAPVPSRVGRSPLRIKGLEKQGTLKTNVIISKEDADKIKRTPSLLKALQKANLVIITDPLIAGIQGNSKNRFIYRVNTF